MSKEEVKLTPEQEKIILDAFKGRGEDLPSITDLVKLIAPQGVQLDGRSLHGKAIKEFLIKNNLKATTKTTYKPKDKIELTESQKEFIRNNYSDMSILDMAKTLFDNNLLTGLHQETRSVGEYANEIKGQENTSVAEELQEIPEKKYTPPKTISGIWQKVDKYILNHGIDKAHPTAQQKAGLEALLTYMSSFRFIHQINLYSSQTDRDLFESSFVRYAYDKPDLESEEIDLFINCAGDNVSLASSQKRIDTMNNVLTDAIANAAAEDKARISMGLVETIKALNEEFNKTSKRQSDLFGKLNVSRADRMAEKKNAHASVLNLVQLWVEEASRKKLLYLADARNKIFEQGVKELSDMDAIKATILGVDPDSIING